MPVYDYECEECGVFTAFRPMSEYKSPLACPGCGRDTARVFLAVPAIAGMDPGKRKAMAVNERSSHEPRSTGRSHGPGCSCCSNKAKTAATKSPGGAKGFPTKRPWMISH
jgi:putative FmdB family regulatory protein